MREKVKGLSSCPFCEGETELEYIEKEGEVGFRAICTNPNCGCQSPAVNTIKKLQDVWNKRSTISMSAHNVYDILPTIEEAVIDTKEDSTRTFRLMRVQQDESTDYQFAYYDGKNFNSIITKKPIDYVISWEIVPGGMFETKPPKNA